MENNRYVKLTESELKQVINEAVIKILQENQENEGFWDNMKSALKGTSKYTNVITDIIKKENNRNNDIYSIALVR